MKLEVNPLLNSVYKLADSYNLEVSPDIQTILLVKGEENQFEASDKEMLEKMISAIKQSESSLIVYVPEGQKFPITSLQKHNQIRYLIGFGMNPPDLVAQIRLRPYAIMAIDPLKTLFCHRLDQVSESKELKTKLWTALQEMYP